MTNEYVVELVRLHSNLATAIAVQAANFDPLYNPRKDQDQKAVERATAELENFLLEGK